MRSSRSERSSATAGHLSVSWRSDTPNSSMQLFCGRIWWLLSRLSIAWHDAWPHLIPPATAARNLTQRHLPIMESCTSNPEAMRQQLRSPVGRWPIRQLWTQPSCRDHTIAGRNYYRSSRRNLIELSEGIAELSSMLEQRATGCGLERETIPDLTLGSGSAQNTGSVTGLSDSGSSDGGDEPSLGRAGVLLFLCFLV